MDPIGKTEHEVPSIRPLAWGIQLEARATVTEGALQLMNKEFLEDLLGFD